MIDPFPEPNAPPIVPMQPTPNSAQSNPFEDDRNNIKAHPANVGLCNLARLAIVDNFCQLFQPKNDKS